MRSRIWMGLGLLAVGLGMVEMARAQQAEEPKFFEGNEPRPIEMQRDGTMSLPASACEVYGPELEYMLEDRALGYWHQTSDYCSWRLRGARPGRYVILIEWSCAPESAGNAFELTAGAARLTNRVPSSGNWQTHRWGVFGEIELERDDQVLTVRPLPGIRRALMDLREVRLVPVIEPRMPIEE